MAITTFQRSAWSSPRAIALGAAAVAIALWLAVIGWIGDSRHERREAIAEETRALATMIAAQLGRELQSPDQAVPGVPLRGGGFVATLKPAAAFAIDQALLIRDDGVVLAATEDESAAIGTLVAIAAPVDGARSLGLESGAGGRIIARAAARVPDRPMFVAIARKLQPASAWRSGETVVVALAMLLTLILGATVLLMRRRPLPVESRLQEGVERMADGFLLWDSEERLVTWNARFLKLLPAAADLVRPGIAYETLLRELMRRVRADVPDGADFEMLIADLLRGHRDATGAWEITTPAGRRLEVEETRTPSGGIVAVYRDVTDRRRQEAVLQKALQAERDANLLHRRFVAMASHEFRTPLAVIDGAAQRLLAATGAAPAGAAGRIERIRGAVAQLAVLIDRLLSSSQIEEARPALAAERTDLRDLLTEAIDAQRRLSPRFEIRLRMPDFPVQAEVDRRLIGQVLASLLSNAVKYSGASRGVDVELDVSAAAVDEAIIRVTDQGVGIPSAEVGKLFERFFRASTAQGTLGTGTALHLARQIVDLHRGRIDVSSELGSGTTFTLRLPLQRHRAAA